MHAAEIPFGGVSPRFTRRSKGQSTVEYVLIIVIIVLVVLIAGPWVSSAITNQFNTVAGTLGNGISKGSWESGGTGGGNGSLTDADIVDPVHGIAFAVYSEDDHSLMFYKRRGVPRVGDMLNSRRVTAVYTGFENGYATATVGNDGKTTAPWWPNRNNIVAVKAIDDGIEIHSLAFCFQYMENCKSFDLAKFDMSNCTNLQHAFAYCGNATSFSISSWDTSSVVEFDSALKNLYKVEEIDISGWSTRKAGDLRLLFSTDSSLKSVKFGPGWKTSDVMDMLGMFSYCKNLNLDCSDWNVPTYANHSDFNHCAPGVILPKAWQ